MPNLFSKATPTQTLSQATFYLTYARITTDEQLALSMCDDAEAALARLGNPPSDLRQKVINAYIDLGKLQTELGLIDNATNTNKKMLLFAFEYGLGHQREGSGPGAIQTQVESFLG
ncbi:hypothetical protein B0O80DRAFT_429843 [Mortierella sp. GBAus27b]|nr:hypothetical protein B0O80DRAFT_429843 [Mortierella sp. GBAus27b]